MKHPFLAVAVGTLLFTACSSEPSYTITGTVPADVPDGGTVYLRKERKAVVDSAIIKNHTFVFTGRQDSAVQRWFTYQEGNHSFSGILFVENGDIKLSYNEGQCNVTGSPLNDRYYQFMTEFNQKNLVVRDLYKKCLDEKTSQEERLQLQEQMQKIGTECSELVDKTITANVKNAVGVMMIPKFGRQYPEAKQKEWILQVPENMRTDRMKGMLDQFAKLEKTAVGQKFLDFSMKTPSGEEKKLSDYVKQNKYTLLDFWASWCGPCRAEMPNIVKAYHKYHKKGFGIVSVSLDEDAQRWTQAIKTLKMDWDHLSDLKGWQSVGSDLYGVGGIPATVLIANDGTIIARDLFGESLEAKLDELLK